MLIFKYYIWLLLVLALNVSCLKHEVTTSHQDIRTLNDFCSVISLPYRMEKARKADLDEFIHNIDNYMTQIRKDKIESILGVCDVESLVIYEDNNTIYHLNTCIYIVNLIEASYFGASYLTLEFDDTETLTGFLYVVDGEPLMSHSE